MIDVRSVVRPGGLLERWLQFTDPFEFADSYALFSLLACASAAINGRILVNPDTEPCVKTNLYVLLYGPPGNRKGPPMRYAAEALVQAVPETPRLPRSFSMSALTEVMAEQSDEHGKCGGLIYTEEFHRLIGGQEYLADNLSFLSELWDCPKDYPRRTRTHGEEVLLNPYTVIVAASNPDWLEIDPRALSGGALRRILTVNEYGPKRDDATSPVRNMGLYEKVVADMAARLGRRAFRATNMILADSAQQVMDEWYRTRIRGLRQQADVRLGYFVSCMQAHALKLAAVVHLLEGGQPHLLTGDSMREGQALIEALLPGTAQLYASLVPTPYAKLRAGIMRAVGTAGPEGLAALDLDRMLSASHGVKPRDVGEARVDMVREGLLTFIDGRYKSG